MPDHAGFAAAITIRDQVLNDAFLNSYHAGTQSHTLLRNFAEGLIPRGTVNFFLQPAQVVFSNTDHENGILRLSGWGKISIRANQFPVSSEERDVQWQADLRIKPEALVVGKIVLVTAKSADYQLARWHFDVLSGIPFSTAADLYLNGGLFQLKLKAWLRKLIGDLVFPIDFSSLGPVGTTAFLDAAIRLVDGALLLGLNMDLGEEVTQGTPGQLLDFDRDNQIAFVINPVVIPMMMRDAETLVREAVAEEDATLERFEITAEEGRFRARGRASATDAAAPFSPAVLPLMSYTRPGAYLWTSTGRVPVKSRTWPALSFTPAEVSVDIDRSWWVVLIELVGSVLTLGFIPFAVEASISEIIRNITGGQGTPNVERRA